MNMFDSLLQICLSEKQLQKFLVLPMEARIFNFQDATDFTIIDKEGVPVIKTSGEQLVMDTELLRLPFPVTAIVKPNMCIIFVESEASKEALTFLARIQVLNPKGSTMNLLIHGAFTWAEISEAGRAKGVVELVFAELKGKWRPIKLGIVDIREFMPILVPPLHDLIALNTADRFILEISPINPGVRSKKYIPKSHQRPEYILLHPKEIRKYMKTEHEIEGHSRAGHERRGHYRQYPDDKERFPQAHGKRIFIEAVWIGSTEATVGKKHYRVIF